MKEDKERMEAALALHRMAEAGALIRLVGTIPSDEIKPTEEDYRRVIQENPDLAALAGLGHHKK